MNRRIQQQSADKNHIKKELLILNDETYKMCRWKPVIWREKIPTPICSCTYFPILWLCTVLLQGPLAGRAVVCLGLVPQLWRLSGLLKLWAVQHDSPGRPPQPQLHRVGRAAQVRLQWLQSVTVCSFCKTNLWQSAESLQVWVSGGGGTCWLLALCCTGFDTSKCAITCFNV